MTERARLPQPVPTRRALIAAGAGLIAAPFLVRAARAEADLAPGDRFDLDTLALAMRRAAGRPFRPAPPPAGGLVATYDAWRRIRWRPERTRWDRAGGFGLQAFAPGWLFPDPVALFDVTDGRLRPLPVTPADFEQGGIPLAEGVALPGVAGVRLLYPLNRPDRQDELVAFLGASYFRALGQGSAYGLSARGLAVDTAATGAEEFPRFTAFYLARPAPGATEAVVHAALDGPRVTGAYRFAIRPGPATEIDVTARLFFREGVDILGIGCLTSMHLFDAKNRAAFDDHRPRVHDSEGLAVVTAAGEAIWRPLNNPPRMAQSWFEGMPRSFALCQRTRDPEAYRDPEARYHRRPSAEVMPLSDWGPGHVRLVELPARDESEDNIVAAFVPGDGRAGAGEARDFAWRIRWGDLPADGTTARVIATHAGTGGVPGAPRPADTRKFVVDFAGPGLPPPPAGPEDPVPLSADLRVAGGDIATRILQPLTGGGWRLVFDLRADPGTVAEMTARLIYRGAPVSETWACQWVTPP